MVTIQAHQVNASQGKSPNWQEALTRIESALEEAMRRGFVDIQFEARLASGEIEMKFGKLPGSRERLKILGQEAREKGFTLIEMKTADILRTCG